MAFIKPNEKIGTSRLLQPCQESRSETDWWKMETARPLKKKKKNTNETARPVRFVCETHGVWRTTGHPYHTTCKLNLSWRIQGQGQLKLSHARFPALGASHVCTVSLVVYVCFHWTLWVLWIRFCGYLLGNSRLICGCISQKHQKYCMTNLFFLSLVQM